MTVTEIHAEAERRNARITRRDIEWAVGPGGLYLRDRPEFTRWNTENIERRHENERREWMRHND